MQRIETKMLAIMFHFTDPLGVGEHAAECVGLHGVVRPTAFPQFVHDLHIFARDVVAIVVRGLLVAPGAPRGAVEIAGDDVPTDAPIREVIERRHAAREIIGRLERKVCRHAEPEMPRCGGHRRDKEQRIVDGNLRRVRQSRACVAAEDVVDAQHVGDEQAVEQTSLQDLRQLDPIAQALVVARAVARMAPQPRRLMRDAVHLERVEPDFLEHRRCWRGAASAIPDLVCARASFRSGAALSSDRGDVAILRARMRLGQASPCIELLAQCADLYSLRYAPLHATVR